MSDNNLTCPKCESNRISKNGKIHNGKQNYRSRLRTTVYQKLD